MQRGCSDAMTTNFVYLFEASTFALQAWLRDMAWLEADYEKSLMARAAPHEPDVREKLLQEPLFCFERAVSIQAACLL